MIVKLPCRVAWNVNRKGVGAKPEIQPPEKGKPARAMTRAGSSTCFFPKGAGDFNVWAR